MIFILSPSQDATPANSHEQNPRAQEIFRLLKEKANRPQPVWRFLDELAKGREPGNREDLRYWRLQYWAHLRELLRARDVVWAGRGLISLPTSGLGANSPRTTRSSEAVSRNRIVVRSALSRHGSTKIARAARQSRKRQQEDGMQLKATALPGSQSPEIPKPDEGLPNSTNERIAAAASALAKMRRRGKRRLSGFVEGRRIFRGQPVLLPDGSNVFALGARRGKLVFFRDWPAQLENGRWGVASAVGVELVKDSNAVLLGSTKRGCIEHSSQPKAESSRKNGRMPCHPGRRRGRPRKVTSDAVDGCGFFQSEDLLNEGSVVARKGASDAF